MKRVVALIVCAVILCGVALSETAWPVFDEHGYYSNNGAVQVLETTRPKNTARPVQMNANTSDSGGKITSIDLLESCFIVAMLLLPFVCVACVLGNDKAKKKKAFANWFYSKECVADIDRMSGRDFELYVAKLLMCNGYKNAYATKASGDKGADVIAVDRKGNKIAVQCKLHAKNVGIRAVQEAYSSMAYYDCSKSAVITNRYFTRAAIDFANHTGTVLWDRDDLARFVSKAKQAS